MFYYFFEFIIAFSRFKNKKLGKCAIVTYNNNLKEEKSEISRSITDDDNVYEGVSERAHLR